MQEEKISLHTSIDCIVAHSLEVDDSSNTLQFYRYQNKRERERIVQIREIKIYIEAYENLNTL